ncbi:MAG: RNA polymerase sigma factor [Ruminococcus sp.]|nr:RNA polymerase sigma factor [Ruminococcus sp.]
MDSKLLKELYSKYYRELYLYIYSLCRNREITEDLVQETFLKAILSLPQSHTNMRAWLYMVARNLYFNFAKREKSKVDIDQLKEMPSQEPPMIEHIIANENRRLCFEALQSLGGIKKEVLILQYFGGLSQKEIAAVLHLTPENVRVLSFRGKKELKKFMEVHGYDI